MQIASILFLTVSLIAKFAFNNAYEREHRIALVDNTKSTCSPSELYNFSETIELYSKEPRVRYSYSIVPLFYNEDESKYELGTNASKYDVVHYENRGMMGIKIKLEYDGQGWMAVGLSRKHRMQMIDGQIVLVQPNNPPSLINPGKHVIRAGTPEGIVPMQNTSQTLINTSLVQTGESTILEFTKILHEEGEYSVELVERTSFIWAIGSSNNLAVHKLNGGFFINPDEACFQYHSSSSVKVRLHKINYFLWMGSSISFWFYCLL